LARENPVRFARKYLRHSALVNAALVLCPESGCSASLAKDLISGDECFLDKMDEDLVERVLVQRARNFAGNRYGRQERLDTPTVNLLAAISPKAAAELVWRRKPHDLRQQGNLKETITQGERNQLVNDIENGGFEGSELVERLKKLKMILEPEGDDHRQWIDLMVLAKTTAFSQHPLNLYRDGLFIPASDEIERASDASRRLP
jgi:hypothetical protein